MAGVYYTVVMKKISFLLVAVVSVFLLGGVVNVSAEVNSLKEFIPSDQFQALPAELQQPQSFSTGKILEIIKEGEEDIFGMKQKFQNVKLQLTSGKESGKEISLKHGGTVALDANQLVHVGQTVVIAKTGEGSYFIADRYRLPSMMLALLLFVLVVLYFARLKGVMSLVALVLSFTVLIGFIVPFIVKGYSPLIVTLIGSFLIAVIGMLISHGFTRRTMVAVISTLATLAIAIGLSVLFVELVQLFGAGSEETAYLKLDPTLHINLKGLLLSGIIIGTLGVLDDVTMTQVASVDELVKANNTLSRSELYRRGLSIGKEHIASVVNTLVLAYAGASMPLFLLFTRESTQPLWATLNSEFIAQEFVMTFIGSVALVLGVPISTYLAAKYLSKK